MSPNEKHHINEKCDLAAKKKNMPSDDTTPRRLSPRQTVMNCDGCEMLIERMRVSRPKRRQESLEKCEKLNWGAALFFAPSVERFALEAMQY